MGVDVQMVVVSVRVSVREYHGDTDIHREEQKNCIHVCIYMHIHVRAGSTGFREHVR